MMMVVVVAVLVVLHPPASLSLSCPETALRLLHRARDRGRYLTSGNIAYGSCQQHNDLLLPIKTTTAVCT